MLDIEKVKEAGYDITEIDEEIYLIKNFISEDERLEMFNLADSTPENAWSDSYMESLAKRAKVEFGRDDLENVIEEGLIHKNSDWIDKSITVEDMRLPYLFANRLRDIVIDRSYAINAYAVVQRHYPGSMLAYHVDQNHDPNLKYATVIYLNDDYNGGLLHFPDRNIEIKPPKGSLVIFSAAKGYLHGVKTVEDGPTRYVMTSFVWK